MRLLVVEDHKGFRMGLRSILEAEGFEVAVALSGEDALQCVVRCKPDVVLMDLYLPGMLGIEATRRVLRLAPQTAVVMLSLFESADLVDCVLDAGASSYLLKDASLDEILSAIESAAVGRRLSSASPLSRRSGRRVGRPTRACDLSLTETLRHDPAVARTVARTPRARCSCGSG